MLGKLLGYQLWVWVLVHGNSCLVSSKIDIYVHHYLFSFFVFSEVKYFFLSFLFLCFNSLSLFGSTSQGSWLWSFSLSKSTLLLLLLLSNFLQSFSFLLRRWWSSSSALILMSIWLESIDILILLKLDLVFFLISSVLLSLSQFEELLPFITRWFLLVLLLRQLSVQLLHIRIFLTFLSQNFGFESAFLRIFWVLFLVLLWELLLSLFTSLDQVIMVWETFSHFVLGIFLLNYFLRSSTGLRFKLLFDNIL